MAVADGEWDEDGVGLAGGDGWKSPGEKCKKPLRGGAFGEAKKTAFAEVGQVRSGKG